MKKFRTDSEQRKRVSLDLSSPQITDQSSKKMSDINNIMLQYSKTGLLPVQQEKVAQYIDNTQIMPLEEAHAQIQHAKELFYALPAQIRKLMDNDPTKLKTFIEDKENYDILVKHDVIIPVKKPESKKPDFVASATKTEPSVDSKN